MLKLIKQELVDEMFNLINKGIEKEGLPGIYVFGFEADDYDGRWRECRTSLMRQVIAPLLQKYEISNIAFYDDKSFEFTIEEERETFV